MSQKLYIPDCRTELEKYLSSLKDPITQEPVKIPENVWEEMKELEKLRSENAIQRTWIKLFQKITGG